MNLEACLDDVLFLPEHRRQFLETEQTYSNPLGRNKIEQGSRKDLCIVYDNDREEEVVNLRLSGLELVYAVV